MTGQIITNSTPTHRSRTGSIVVTPDRTSRNSNLPSPNHQDLSPHSTNSPASEAEHLLGGGDSCQQDPSTLRRPTTPLLPTAPEMETDEHRSNRSYEGRAADEGWQELWLLLSVGRVPSDYPVLAWYCTTRRYPDPAGCYFKIWPDPDPGKLSRFLRLHCTSCVADTVASRVTDGWPLGPSRGVTQNGTNQSNVTRHRLNTRIRQLPESGRVVTAGYPDPVRYPAKIATHPTSIHYPQV